VGLIAVAALSAHPSELSEPYRPSEIVLSANFEAYDGLATGSRLSNDRPPIKVARPARRNIPYGRLVSRFPPHARKKLRPADARDRPRVDTHPMDQVISPFLESNAYEGARGLSGAPKHTLCACGGGSNNSEKRVSSCSSLA
jgi:hypothetical protein